MGGLKILNIKFDGLRIFDDEIDFDFFAEDRVVDEAGTFNINKSINVNNIISIIGLNAVGKTTLLKIISFVFEIIINNKSLNEIYILNFYNPEGLELEVTFYKDDKFHKLKSNIGMDIENGDIKLFYEEEFLKSVEKSKISSKVKLRNFIDLDLNNENSDNVRTNLPENMKSILKSDDSIVTIITKDNNIEVNNMLDTVNINLLKLKKSVPGNVLNLFDESIEFLIFDKNKKQENASLKFKNDDGIFSANESFAFGDILSSGTVKGNNMFFMCLNVLKTGGYLIVDELENHYNKQLINAFLDLFNDKRINKHGATIIFTTHYTEIIDFIERKDNIYVLQRNDEYLSSVNKLSNLINRSDIKKSEIILSNALGKTAPSYKSIRDFKKYVKNEVLNDE